MFRLLSDADFVPARPTELPCASFAPSRRPAACPACSTNPRNGAMIVPHRISRKPVPELIPVRLSSFLNGERNYVKAGRWHETHQI